MKRLFILAICFILLITSTSCRENYVDTDFEPESAEGAMRKTVLYYATDEGLIIPIVREIAWDEGIACSALSYLVASGDNETEVRRHGLCAVIPDGTTFSLKIDDEGRAVLDVRNMPALPDADTEKVFLQTVVNTLTEFDTINRVDMTFDGKYTAVMPHGTRINRDMNSFMLNPVNTETETIAQGSISTVSLFIPDFSCNYIIPITGYVTGERDFQSAMSLFCDSFSKECSALPYNTECLSASLTSGTALVNFSDEFADLADNDGVLQAVYKAIYLTAKEYGDVENLKLCAGGKPLNTDGFSVPEYVNGW